LDLTLRSATVEDAETLARLVIDGSRCIAISRRRGAAITEARGRGYARMRLFTPAAQVRARRFYEREGWVQAGEEFHSPGPDLVIVEYRYRLAAEPMAG
jgi:GNAT superfamily N-acetyltransferase